MIADDDVNASRTERHKSNTIGLFQKLIAAIVLILLICFLGNLIFRGDELQSSGESLILGSKRHKDLTYNAPAMLSSEAGKISHTFHISNTNDTPIKITNINKSCTCTDIHMDSEDIAPGATAKLTMIIDLAGRSGDFTSIANLASNTGHTWICRFKVMLYKNESWAPSLLDFGTSKPGILLTGRSQLISVHRGEEPSMPSISVRRHDSVSVALINTKVDRPEPDLYRRTTDFSVTFDVPKDMGAGFATVASDMTPQHDAGLRLIWRTEVPYKVSPSTAVFAADAAKESIVILRHRDGIPFTIRRIDLDCKNVICDCKTLQTFSNQHEIHLALSGQSNDFLFGKAMISVEADENSDHTQQVINIPIAAYR